MKILSNKRDGNTIVLEVEEDYASFKTSVEKELVEASKEIKLPGFRPGKAPKDMVEKAINQDMLEARAAQGLVSDLYPKILQEAKIDPVDFPRIEIVQLKTNKPFIFKASIDVYPEVKLGKYKGLKVEKAVVSVTDDDVIKVLEDIHKRFSKAVPEGENKPLELNDEFAKKFSRFGTLAELKIDLKENMTRDKKEQAEADVKNQLIGLVAQEVTVDLPPGMVEAEISLMLDELKGSLAQSGLTLEQYLMSIKKDEKNLRDEIRKSAQIRVKGKVILLAIAEAEKFEISEEEMEAELKTIAQGSGEELEDIKKRIKADGKKYIDDYLLRRKALDFLLAKAKMTEKPAKADKEAKS